MGDHDNPSTCLSSREHDRRVRDVFLHYSGCLRETPRKEFFRGLMPHEQERIRLEEQRIRNLRALFNHEEQETQGLAKAFKESLNQWRQSKPSLRSMHNSGSSNNADLQFVRPDKANGFDLYANMIFYRDSLPYSHEGNFGEFPDQKIPLQTLLYDRKPANTPLSRKCEENEIRYFHIPGNNMEWVEEAIARHYNEERPEYDGIFHRPEQPSKTYMLLRPEFWRGQQHGGRHDAVHARHMRARCDMLSTDPDNLEDTLNNLVLFMPYLHWETDRRRSQFADLMRNITEKHRRKQHQFDAQGDKTEIPNFPLQTTAVDESHQLQSRHGRNEADVALCEEASLPVVPSDGTAGPNGQAISLQAMTHDSSTARSTVSQSPRHLHANGEAGGSGIVRPCSQPQSVGSGADTGKFSLARNESIEEAYRLKSRTATEAMQAKFDQEMKQNPRSKFSKSKYAKDLRKTFVPATSLGQTLYNAAQLSEAMDCYHEEKVVETFLHNNPPLHPRRTLDQSYYWTLRTTKKRDRDQVVYRGTSPKKGSVLCGCENTDKKGCEHTQENSRKIPRVIMVDQLWLWILNGNTLITSFPKRYGRNRQDSSAVHACIRRRLKVARKNEIRSVYDLALIVVDECCKVFFEMTKTVDRKPQVMDLFATAIGNVTNRQTIAYQHFWDTTQEASNVYKSAETVGDIEDKAKSLLDINPEGVLLREIKDILDEIHLLLNIKIKQQRVFKEFNKHVEYMIARPLALSKEIGTAKQTRVTGDVNGDAPASNYSRGNEHEITPRADIGDAKTERDAKWTLQFALDLAARLDDRVADLNNLEESAQHTERALDGLLGLKQQQAGVVQAREAVRQAEETLRQGRSIMLFTVITIIFLPLSFGASVFGMNNSQFGPNWTLRHEVKYMFSISFVVILTSFILAFSTFTRAVISYVFDVGWTMIITKTGIYTWWHEFKGDSKEIRKWRKDKTRKLKEDAIAKQQLSRKKKHQKKEAEEAKKEEHEDNRGTGTDVRGAQNV